MHFIQVFVLCCDCYCVVVVPVSAHIPSCSIETKQKMQNFAIEYWNWLIVTLMQTIKLKFYIICQKQCAGMQMKWHVCASECFILIYLLFVKLIQFAFPFCFLFQTINNILHKSCTTFYIILRTFWRATHSLYSFKEKKKKNLNGKP